MKNIALAQKIQDPSYHIARYHAAVRYLFISMVVMVVLALMDGYFVLTQKSPVSYVTTTVGQLYKIVGSRAPDKSGVVKDVEPYSA